MITVRRTCYGFRMGGDPIPVPPVSLSPELIETWVKFWERAAANEDAL